MMPTISHSATATDTSRLACTPPNLIETWRASSTDIGDLHLLQAPVAGVEAAPAEPAHDGPDLLADAAGEARQVEQQEERADDERSDLRRQVARRRDRGEDRVGTGDVL